MKTKRKLGMGLKIKRRKQRRRKTLGISKVKKGGFLPFLAPILAGLTAVGSLAGGAASISKSVNDASAARKRLEEMARHHKAIEGRGLYLAPYKQFKRGRGLYITKR